MAEAVKAGTTDIPATVRRLRETFQTGRTRSIDWRKQQLRALEHGFSIRMVETSHDSIGVDTPEDLERVRRLLTAGARV